MRNQEAARTTEGDEKFMTLLRRHRIARGLTQEALARRMKVSPSSVSYWESGDWIPHPSKIPKLARILGMDPLELTRVIEPELSHPGAAAK